MPELFAHSTAMISPHAQGDAVLIADPSMTGEAIAAALRSLGFMVIEVSAELLAARALAEAPRAIVVDVDHPGAIDAVERARELLANAPPVLFCLGDPLRAAELGMTRGEGRVFARPIDIGGVIAAIAAAVSPRQRGDRSPPTIAQRRPTYPPRPSEIDESPPASEMPSTNDPLEVAEILPSLEDTASPSRIFAHELSPELERILVAAEQRVFTQHRPSSIPSPEEELDFLLPPELLATLDEPLDPDDEGGGTGSGSGSGSGGGATNAPKVHTGASANRNASLTAETTAGDGAARRPVPPEQTEARMPISVAMPQAMDTRFDSRSFAITPEAGMPVVPSIHRRGSSTLPPSGLVGHHEPPAQLGPAHEPREVLRPQVVVPVGKPGAPPLIRDGAAPSRWNPQAALGVETTPNKPSASPTLPLFPPPAHFPSSPDIAWSGRPIEPAAEIEVARTSPAQETTSSGRSAPPSMPSTVLAEADAILVLARAVAARASGALAVGAEPLLRRIVLHDGDIVTAGSTAPDETLLAFLAARGDLPREVAARLTGRLPPSGRHAGAALIAHGHLGQDDLWPVLRAHAEWLIGRAITCDSGTGEIEPEPPGRLRAEPNVFGGATGAEVLVEAVRRVISPDLALRKLGGGAARLAEGSRRALLSECALRRDEEALVLRAPGCTVSELQKGAEPEIASVIYALVALGVLDALAPAAPTTEEAAASVDMLDAEALRQRVRARVSLVEDGDYFAVLGVPRSATGYEVRRAYLELRRSFEPSHVLTAATADLVGAVRLIVEVLDEAYDILRDPHRRERYRKAIDAGPP